MRSFSSGSASASCRPVARKTCICSSVKPGLDPERRAGAPSARAALPISSASSRLAVSSGGSPSTSSLPAGQLEQVGLADRPRAAGAPATRARRRTRRSRRRRDGRRSRASTTSPSSWRKRSSRTDAMLALPDRLASRPARSGCSCAVAPRAARRAREPPASAAAKNSSGPRRSCGPSSWPAARTRR